MRADADGPGAQSFGSPAPTAQGKARRPEFQGAHHHRADGSQSFRAPVTGGNRGCGGPLAAPDRAPVPPGDGPLSGALLSGAPARPCAPPAASVDHAGGRSGGRVRLRLRFAFFQMLPRALCPLAAAGAYRPQAAHGGLAIQGSGFASLSGASLAEVARKRINAPGGAFLPASSGYGTSPAQALAGGPPSRGGLAAGAPFSPRAASSPPR